MAEDFQELYIIRDTPAPEDDVVVLASSQRPQRNQAMKSEVVQPLLAPKSPRSIKHETRRFKQSRDDDKDVKTDLEVEPPRKKAYKVTVTVDLTADSDDDACIDLTEV